MGKTIKQILALVLVAIMVTSVQFVPATAVNFNGSYELLGDATQLANKAIELTPLDYWKVGGCWYQNKFDVSNGLEVSFSYWAGGGRGDSFNGADGIVLIFSNNTYNLGSAGGDLGFVRDSALGIEFDSYDGNSGDPSGKHIAVVKDNVSNHLKYIIDDRTDDSQWHNVLVNIINNTVVVNFDGTSILTYSGIDFLDDNLYVGVAASTGSGRNRQIVKNFTVCDSSSTVVPIIYNGKEYGSYQYSDHYFSEESTKYNHSLATMSLMLEVSSFNSDDVVKMFKNIGFSEKSNYEDVYLYGYDNINDIDSIACAIDSKNINSNTTVIACAVRGGNYGIEWGGDFNLGETNDHEGFVLAKNKVIEYLNQYIESNSDIILENVKLWLTGFSRGAATANLVAAALDTETTGSSVIENLNIKKENVYCYTFETPQCTTDSYANSSAYNNIFNIINPIDVITYVAPQNMGFCRYGIDLYYPTKEIDENYYKECIKGMSQTYKDLFGLEYVENFTFYEFAIKYNPLVGMNFSIQKNKSIGQMTYAKNLVKFISSDIIGSRTNYVQYYQDSIEKLATEILGKGNKFDNLKNEFFGRIGKYILDCLKCPWNINNYANSACNDIIDIICESTNIDIVDFAKLYSKLGDILVGLVKHPNYCYTLTQIESANVIDNSYSLLFYPHSPEISLAWMFYANGNTLRTDLEYREIKANCPIDIYVYDSNDTLVASIINDEVIELDGKSLSAFVDENGQKCISLPNNEKYSIEMLATDNGSVSCSIMEYAENGIDVDSIVNYYNLSVEKGDVLSCIADNKEKHQNCSYPMSLNNNDTIDPLEVIDGEQIEEYTVNVTSNMPESSSIIGGGKFYKGEFAQVTAFFDENTEFLGWYENDVLISNDYNYRFMVTDDIDIIARFNINKKVNSVSIDNIEMNYKKTATLNTVIDIDEGVDYTVEYSSSNPSVAKVDENGNVYGAKKGSADITVTVTDEYGNSVSDTCNVKVNYSFGQWLIVILLFGWIWY